MALCTGATSSDAAPPDEGGSAPPDLGEDDFEALPTGGLRRAGQDSLSRRPRPAAAARESPLPPQHPVGRHPRFWVRMISRPPRRAGRE